jgi:predicted Zn-dependent peptidase
MGLFIDCGSRDESPANNGISHLLEHMLFKGTSNRSSLDIVKYIESLGGAFDAYTTKENLVIITKFLSEHISNVFNLISELLLESKIAKRELIKEKSVILEEIKSNIEDPSDYVFDLFFKSLFPDHPIGRSIAGTERSVKKIDVRKTKLHYRKLLMRDFVIAVSGNFNQKKVRELAADKFGHLGGVKARRIKPVARCAKTIVQRKKDISQVHVVFGLPGVAFTSPLRYHFSIMNTAFGGGMSSRLFQGLREQKGLVYNVQSFLDFYSDCGISGFYFVCDKDNLKGVAKQLKSIFADLDKDGFHKEEINLAKTYLSGNLLLSLESSTNRMLRLGREMLNFKKIATIDEVIAMISKINEQHINDLIEKYLNPKKYTIAAIGPITIKEIDDIFRA